MSILSDFLDTYKPVQVIRLPLGEYLYKADAISGLASAVSDLSANLDDYETHKELSTKVETNELSAGVLSVGTSVLSVEYVDGYSILNILNSDGTSLSGKRVYNLTNGNVVQAVVPRTEVDANVTVFNPVPGRYFKMIALVDDRSMVDPDAVVNMNLDVVEIDESEIDPLNDEIRQCIYIRIPGSNEKHDVLSIGVDFSEEGLPNIQAVELLDELDVELGQVVNKVFFTGKSIQTNGEFPPMRVDLMIDNTSYPHSLYLVADSEYAQSVVEHEMRVLIQRQQKQITVLNRTLDKIKGGLSGIVQLDEDCTPEMQRTTINAILTTLSNAVYGSVG